MAELPSRANVPPAERVQDLKGERLAPLVEFNSVGLIYNPISGQGRSRQLAAAVAGMLSSNQISSQLIESSRQYDHVTIQDQLRPLDVIMVAGGDGTLMGLLPHLAESGKPVYMIPSGNESLFSRAFGMSRDPQSVFAALRQGQVEKHAYAEANGAAFFTMATVGIDSVIVNEISSRRTGPIGHIGYVIPTLKQLLYYSPPCITLKVDGVEVISDQPGYLIVANTSQYALGLNLVPEADSSGQHMFARFFPKGDVLRLMAIAAGRLCGLESSLSGSLLFHGRKFEISGSGDFPAQADGEAIGALPLTIERSSKPVLILRPAAK